MLLINEDLLNRFISSLLDPANNGGYTLVNSPFFWALFGISLYSAWKVAKKYSIKINSYLAYSSIPFILAGTIIRAFADSGILPYSTNPFEVGFYTHSPGLWIAIFLFMLISLLISIKLLPNKQKYLKIWGFLGFSILIFFILALFLVSINYYLLFLQLIMIALVSTIAIKVGQKLVKGFEGEHLNYLALVGQTVDGIGTFFMQSQPNCFEQHFFSREILGYSPFLYVILKIALTLVSIYLIDYSFGKKDEKGNFIKYAIILLGFMTGPRNVWTVSLGNCN